jgi:nitroreductase
MQFLKSVFEIISKRKSVRNYEGGPISEAVLKKLEDSLKKLPSSPFGSKVRFLVASAGAGDAEALKGLGTYGVIRKPAGFVIGAVDKTDLGLVDFGHQMETIVLLLTDLGFGSCWLGGTFRKNRFSERINASKTECVPSVLSFGIPAEKPRAFEMWMRKGVGSDSRKPFESLFFRQDFAHLLSRAEAGPLERILDAVRLAPSASNRQPWRIVLNSKSDAFHFFLRHDAAYRRQLKWFNLLDLQNVDMGIATCHFELAAGESSLTGHWVARNPGLAETPQDMEYVLSWIELKK